MRVNIYAEEMTDRIEIISKTIEGREFTGCRFYMYLPVTDYGDGKQTGALQHRGPFMHTTTDDDSAAVTFWGKKDLRHMLAKALDLLDDHYDDGESHHITRVNMAFQTAGPETAGVVLEIARERNRQIEAEGWTLDHDDHHEAGELACAASIYAAAASATLDGKTVDLDDLDFEFFQWPWDRAWFKTTTSRRDLIKAAALIVAEIERIDRTEVDVSRETSIDLDLDPDVRAAALDQSDGDQ